MADTAQDLDPQAWATYLFVPADRPEMLAKAQGRGADAIIVDLEDAVAPNAKAVAQAALREHIERGALSGPSALCVRINAFDDGAQADLEALTGLHLDAVVLPKAGLVEDAVRVRSAMDGLLARSDSVRLIAQVESTRGVVELEPLAGGPIDGIAFGGEDFCVDLGVSRSSESLELLVPRALVALHARAAGLVAIDTVYTEIADEAGLLRETQVAKALGFTGKLLIHPVQVGPVTRVFAPSAEEVAWAERVVVARKRASAAAAGVSVVDGKMVDAPVLAQAQRVLARNR